MWSMKRVRQYIMPRKKIGILATDFRCQGPKTTQNVIQRRRTNAKTGSNQRKNDVKICLNSGCRSFKLFSMYDFFSSSPSLFLIYFSSFRHTLQPGNVPRPVPVRQNSIHQASTVSYSQVFFIKKTVNFMKFSHKLSWDY